MADTSLILHVKGTESETAVLPKAIVREGVSKGTITHSQLIWIPTENTWRPVKELPELLPAEQPTAQEPPVERVILHVKGTDSQTQELPKHDVKAAISKGTITHSQLIWIPNEHTWKPVREVPDLMPGETLILHVKGTEAETQVLPKQAVQAGVSKGQITHSQLIWIPSENSWKPVRELPELLPGERLILHVKGTEAETKELPKRAIRTALAKGEITHSQLIWSAHEHAWKQVRELPELLPSQKLAPAPSRETHPVPRVAENIIPESPTGPVARAVAASGDMPQVRVPTALTGAPKPRVAVAAGATPKVRVATAAPPKVSVLTEASTPRVRVVAVAPEQEAPVASAASPAEVPQARAVPAEEAPQVRVAAASAPQVRVAAAEEAPQVHVAAASAPQVRVAAVEDAPQVRVAAASVPQVRVAPAEEAPQVRAAAPTTIKAAAPAKAKVEAPVSHKVHEDDHAHPLKWICIVMGILIFLVVSGNYLLVDQPLTSNLASTSFPKVSVYAHLGAYVQPNVVVIHIHPSSEITAENLPDVLVALAHSTPDSPITRDVYGRVAITTGWTAQYSFSGYGWKEIGDMQNETTEARKDAIMTRMASASGEPLVEETVSPEAQQAGREKAWQAFVARFTSSP